MTKTLFTGLYDLFGRQICIGDLVGVPGGAASGIYMNYGIVANNLTEHNQLPVRSVWSHPGLFATEGDDTKPCKEVRFGKSHLKALHRLILVQGVFTTEELERQVLEQQSAAILEFLGATKPFTNFRGVINGEEICLTAKVPLEFAVEVDGECGELVHCACISSLAEWSQWGWGISVPVENFEQELQQEVVEWWKAHRDSPTVSSGVWWRENFTLEEAK